MDTKILNQVREQAAALEAVSDERDEARRECEELSRQLAEARQENDRLRQQSAKMTHIDRQFDEIKALVAASHERIKRDLVNEWAVTVAPHMKTTHREVVELREQQAALKQSLGGMLADFEARAEATAKNIVKLFTEQVNACWAVVQDEHAVAEAGLAKLHGANDAALKQQEATVNKLLTAMMRFDGHFVDLLNGSVELSKKNGRMNESLNAAVSKFESVTVGALTEVATTARESILETARDAELEMRKSRGKTIRVLTGLNNKIADHPYLLLASLILSIAVGCTAVGAGIGRWAVTKYTAQMISEAVGASTALVEEKVARLEEQTKGLNQTFEEAQLWQALTNNMTFEQKMAFVKQAQQKIQTERRARGMPENVPVAGALR